MECWSGEEAGALTIIGAGLDSRDMAKNDRSLTASTAKPLPVR